MSKQTIIDVDVVIDEYNKNNPKKKQIDRKFIAEKLGRHTQVLSDWKNKKSPKVAKDILLLAEIGDCDVSKFIIEIETDE